MLFKFFLYPSLKLIENAHQKCFSGNIKSYEEAFSARYKAAYMWFLVQSIEKEIEGKAISQNWQLPRRKVATTVSASNLNHLIICEEIILEESEIILVHASYRAKN